MATQSSILAWRTLWTKEPVGCSPWDSKRIRHDLETKQQQQEMSTWIPHRYPGRSKF